MSQKSTIYGVNTLTYAATLDIDASTGNTFIITLTGNITLAVKNVRPGYDVTVVIIQDGSGSRTVSWAGSGGQTMAGTAAILAPIATANLSTSFVIRGIDATNVRTISNSGVSA